LFADPIRASSLKPTASTGRTDDCTRRNAKSSLLTCNAGAIHRRTVWVDRIFDLPFDVPIGGGKHSGIGRHQGMAGVEEFTQVRIVNAALR